MTFSPTRDYTTRIRTRTSQPTSGSVTFLLLTAFSAVAQQFPVPTAQQSGVLTIATAVAQALKNYPAIQVSEEQLNAASAGIRLARTAYLPHVEALAQANRATRNNVFDSCSRKP